MLVSAAIAGGERREGGEGEAGHRLHPGHR